jgi:hypothetical protein
MKNKRIYLFLTILLLLPCTSSAQNWKFVKEKEGVKLFTRQEAGKNLKFVKGVAEINKPADKVFALIEDVNHTEWWDKNLTQIKVLLYKKNKRAQYYLVYKMPWPFKDRDLSANVTTTVNPVSGECRTIAVPLTGVCAERKNMTRIKDYRQVWTVTPVGNNRAQVELEFYVDPAEELPNWLLNMVLIDSPIHSINTIRQIMEKKE